MCPQKVPATAPQKNGFRVSESRCSCWLGYLDSNQEMTASEAVALPFGDTPIK